MLFDFFIILYYDLIIENSFCGFIHKIYAEPPTKRFFKKHRSIFFPFMLINDSYKASQKPLET